MHLMSQSDFRNSSFWILPVKVRVQSRKNLQKRTKFRTK